MYKKLRELTLRIDYIGTNIRNNIMKKIYIQFYHIVKKTSRLLMLSSSYTPTT